MKQLSDLVKQGVTIKTTQQHSDELPQEIKDVLNMCWSEMKLAKKSWKKDLRSEQDIKSYLTGLGKALMIGRIDSAKKLKYGLEYLYLDESEWLPSAGVFVKWCREGYNQELHQKNMIKNTQRILDERRLLGNGTFEERQTEAKSEIGKLRDILKGKHK